MANLRDGFFTQPVKGQVTQQDLDALDASGMGSLRRGWESGRIGNELNPLRTEALDAELAGNQPLAQSLRGQIDHLQQRQGMYAPAVGRVEDINGVGDGLSWAAGQLGQGAASMADPMAVSAGLSTAGRVASALPGPGKLVGLGLQGAALGIPAYMSKRQLTGEFIGEAERDPALMARTAPQSLRDTAGNYGTLAAIPDSFLLGMVGRQVSGLSRAGSQAARQATMGAGTKTLLNMGLEGGTEALQSAGSQYARGVLNPERDTSGDFMENVNSFAGGAVGAGPFAAAGAYGEAGHNRIDGGVDAVKDATGSVVDLMNNSPTVQAGKQAFGKAKGSVVDLMADKDGEVSATALIDKLKSGTVDMGSRVQGALNERNILNEIPPDDVAADDAKTIEWLGQNRAARHQLVIDKLAAMPEDDAEAQQHLEAAVAEYPDAEAQDQAVSAAARFVLERSPIGRAKERSDKLGENLGKIAGVVGPAIGKGAVAAGKAALGFGKSVLSGAQEGMRKKNAQSNEAPTNESFMDWRDRVYGVQGQAAAKQVLDQAAAEFAPRAELAGNHAADMAKRLRPREPNLALLAKHAAFTMSDMVMRVGAKGLGAQNVRMNRLVDDLYGAFKTEAPAVLQQLGSIMGPKAAPVITYMTQELEQQMTPQGPRAKAAARDALGTQVVSLIDPAAQSKLMAQGINLNTPRGREEVLNLMEDFADGVGSASGMRKALDNTFGPESVAGILELLTGQKEETAVGSVVDDRAKTGEENLDPSEDDDAADSSAFEQRAAEKLVVKGTGPKVFGFHATKNLRTLADGRDMFAPTEKTKAGEDSTPRRPMLFKKGQQLSAEYLEGKTKDMTDDERKAWLADPKNTSAEAVKIAAVRKQLQDDPAYPDHDNYRVEARSAHDVMKDAKMQPGKVLQLYRDYLLQDGDYEASASVGSLLARMVQVTKGDAKLSLKGKNELRAWREENPDEPLATFKKERAERERAALAEPIAAATKDAEAYFKERFVVVGEQLSNRDPSKITLPEVLAMHKEGQGLIERSRLAEDRAAALSDANVLMFKSDAGGGKEIAIPAGKLVKWVKEARGKSSVADSEDTSESFKPKDKDEAYLADVMDGIMALIGSGYVKVDLTAGKGQGAGMPYKINQFGEAESFSAGVVPSSLRLVSKTYGTMKLGEQKRREKAEPVSNDKFQGADQELVAEDQNRNADFFTAEDRADRDLVVDDVRGVRSKRRSGKDDTRKAAQASDEGVPLNTRGHSGAEDHEESLMQDERWAGPAQRHLARGDSRNEATKLRVDRSGQVVADPKTDKDNKTPLDFFPKAENGAPDEYTNQRWLSRQTGADVSIDRAIGHEPKGTAVSSADYRAEAITAAFLDDPTKGQEMIRSRIRMALAPEYTANKPEFDEVAGRYKLTVPGVAGKDQVVGGVHYIAPVAAFISAKNLAKNNVDLEAKTIQAIQAKVANILLKGQVSDAERVKIARLLVAGTDEKITGFNVKPVLQRIAGGVATQGKPIVAKPQSALAQAAIRGMNALYDATSPTVEERIAKGNFEGLGTVAAVDKFLKDAYAAWENGSDDRAVQTELNRMFGEGNFASTDLASFYDGLKGGNAELDHESLLKNLKSAPEVAKAGLPKGQATQSGGRKLNAMAVDIHTDLQRGGFAATHDSPIRHEGKFDWRAHQGKGEGNASFGAGTYLSTSDGVHKSYKGQFTAKVSTPASATFDGEAIPTPTHKSPVFRAMSAAEQQIWHIANLDKTLSGKALLEAAKADVVFQRKTSFGQAMEHILDNDNIPTRVSDQLFEASGMRQDPETGETYRDSDRLDLDRLTELAEAYDLDEVVEAVAYMTSIPRLQAEVMKVDPSRFGWTEANNAVSPTYEVSVDIKPEQLLDWDKSLSGQSELVRKALDGELRWKNEKRWSGETSTNLVIGTTAFGKPIWGPDSNLAGKYLVASSPTDRYGDKFDTLEEAKKFVADEAKKGTLSGDYIYKGLVQRLGSQAKASDYLQSLGILGHKYAASGGRNDTHPNYVIYDDSKITTNYVHFNNQDARTADSKVSTQAERDEAIAYAKKVLGPRISVAFKDITGYSGEFIDAQNAIEISTTAAAGTLGTLYHEAMHVFFRDFVQGNPRVQTVFESLVNDPKHLAKLHALLDGYPAAQAQLVSGEERLAYTYQFWKAGLLEVDAKAHTWLQKLGKFFRRVAGMVRDSERALELFQAFDNGKMAEPSAAGMVIAKAMAKGTAGLKMRRKMDALFQGLAALTFPSAEILGTSVSPTARKLSTMFFTNPGEEAHGKEEIGLMNARRSVAQQYINVSNRRFETMSETDQAAVQKYLQSEAELTDIPYAEHRAAVKDVRDLLERFHQYMTESGMKIGKIDKYYPTVWSTQALLGKKQAFTDMLVSKYAKELAPLNGDAREAADRVWQSLVNKEGVDAHLPTNRDDGVLTPFFASQEMRTLPWLKGEDKEAYLEKDMPLTLTRYFSQGAHATEYFRRFGENGKRLEKMLAAINVELSGAGKEMLRRGEFKDEAARVAWVGRQMRDVTQATGAMEGSLGKDVSPNMRKFNSWMAVYQNIRLLPMALFSSFVDPLSMVARGAPLQAAYETFTYSMREVFRGWADAFKDMPPQRQKDEWRKLSEAIGASEIAMFSNLVSDQYSSTYMTPGAKRINDKMFVFNGMEAWNRGNRIMATKWAVRFIEQHAALPDRHHSARWLHEIGLTPAMITKNAEGNLITNRHELAAAKGISLDEATKEIAHIHNAINRWVEGAVLTPNAAQRPSWSSDPSYASMFHLKQFSYSFHQTILKRATNEFKHGNMAPLGALALFVPTMIGADIMKGLIQGAGTLPPYMASMNAGDWVAHGVQRAGLSGIGVIGMDAATDWASLGGPAFEQIVDAARDGFGSSTALKAAPLHAVYGELVR